MLVKPPTPDPLVLMLLEVVGLCAVLQQTPRVVIEAPLSLRTLPPVVAVLEVKAEIALVVTTGNAKVVTETCVP